MYLYWVFSCNVGRANMRANPKMTKNIWADEMNANKANGPKLVINDAATSGLKIAPMPYKNINDAFTDTVSSGGVKSLA